MKRLGIVPNGWECTLAECPPGLFTYGGTLCMKNEYGTANGQPEAYICDSGELFAGPPEYKLSELIVQPCEAEWVERG